MSSEMQSLPLMADDTNKETIVSLWS